ncbi:hypothetical protein [Paenibacillus glucanolyticus]|uniref:hypothetical protein n=1 Tax=Paenibacillus glucanolyticus TaxID=59843 RepID=UPI00096CC923|nr:hypothetical protein [Paenibacillus glucanolyticus]OMF70484.1 hypothetical protein BK142_23710 [Paenibacillus glucanolyticus]
MAELIYIPFHPESPNATIYFNEKPLMIAAESEWIYSKYAIDRWRISKPVPKQFRKEAPSKWVENGWVEEKEVVQLTLF